MNEQTRQQSNAPGDSAHVAYLLRRLVREAGFAISMLEDALEALWTLDVEVADRVRQSDDRVDEAEVEIERAALEWLAEASEQTDDFRTVAFILKVNGDVERVADHANSIAKIVLQLDAQLDGRPPRWPTALEDLAQRVPAMCHELLRAVLDRNGRAALDIHRSDKTIDQLDRELFEETLDVMEGSNRVTLAAGLLVHRVGRELERVGDLMKSIAEELIYRETGKIVRHQGKQGRMDAITSYEAKQRDALGEGAA